MNPIEEYSRNLTRRQLISRTRGCLGAAALATLVNSDKTPAGEDANSSYPGIPSLPHFAPKAKRVIYLFMAGGPSHIDPVSYTHLTLPTKA